MNSKFNKRVIVLLSLVFITIFSFSQNKGENTARNFNQPKLQWWQEARFGMFIHWGTVSQIGKELSWTRGSYGKQKYDSLYLRFNPIKFDANQWVKIAQNAGMKYMVFTAKHHDGFCMWNTKTTDYNIMKTPFGRDVCKELADAAHKANMPICWYFSPADWKDADCRNPKTNAVFEARVLEQVHELLTNYGKIDLLWIDYEGGPSPLKPHLIYELANKLQPGIIVNNRLDVLHTDESHSFIGPNGDYATPEGFVAGYGAIPWETCTNLGHQWAWRFNDTPRPINDAAALLLRCAGGNGNLLLNVGPDSLGVIPAEFEVRLNEFGSWLKPIAKSIYGTNGGPYSPTPNIVCTYRGKSVFIHVMKFTNDTITMPPLDAKVLTANIINGCSISFVQSKKWLKLIVPAHVQTPIATTIEVNINKPAEKLGIIRPFSTTGSLAYNKKVTASSSVGQFLHDPSAANDDNSSTFWVPGRRKNIDVQKYYGSLTHYIRSKDDIKAIFDTSGWLEVDLGKEQTVGRVKVSERVLLYSKILSFEVQYKKDNKWITWAKDEKMGEWEKELSPVKARYFRLVINEREYMAGIKEFQLFPPVK
jgi:Alpha-L-fucosidase